MNYLSLGLFVIATCGTPGPNNTLVMASGANHGFRRSVPGIIGVNIGFPVMVILVGFALGGALERWPMVLDVLRPPGVLYLLYLAYRVATTPVGSSGTPEGKPLTFWDLALFQFVNPKSWIMVTGALGAYMTTPSDPWFQVLAIATVFFLLGTPCTITWSLIGVGVGKIVSKPEYFRVFNVAMAVLLTASLVPIITEIWNSVNRS